MGTINSMVGRLLFAGLVGSSLYASGCRRTPAEEAAQREAAAREQQAHQQAERLRTQATNVEHQGEQRADEMRNRASNIERAGEERADEIRERASAAPTGPVIMQAAAREQYASARCDRELACNNIGPGKRYSSREACLTTASADRFESWNTETCNRGGVDSSKLRECLDAVRNHSCGNPIEDLQRVTACRGAAVCTMRVASLTP